MPFEVDLSSLLAEQRRAIKALGQIGPDMKRALDRAAAEERRTHAYHNRTFRMQGSTFASGPFGGGNQPVVVEFGARALYASFLDARGLTRVHELAGEVEQELGYHFETVAAGR